MLAQKQKLDLQIEAIRSFNRFYAQSMGVLAQQVYGTDFSLTEMRVLYEIFVTKSTTARDLGHDLDLDGGYLSRILQRLEKNDIIMKRTSRSDARQRKVSLTAKGKKQYTDWAEQANSTIRGILETLSGDEQNRLIDAMHTIEAILQVEKKHDKKLLLRPHKTGDMGLIMHNHVVQFAKDYGWNHEFEALVAEMTGKFIRNFDPQYERCWVADMEGDIMGSVFVGKVSDDTAELRLLYVDPRVRGSGIGKKMVREAVRFSRYAGYTKLVMWTESVFDHAAKLFTDAGFKLVEETPHVRFGKDLIGQYWELEL